MFKFHLFNLLIHKHIREIEVLTLGFKEGGYQWCFFRFRRIKGSLKLCLLGLYLIRYRKDV